MYTACFGWHDQKAKTCDWMFCFGRNILPFSCFGIHPRHDFCFQERRQIAAHIWRNKHHKQVWWNQFFLAPQSLTGGQLSYQFSGDQAQMYKVILKDFFQKIVNSALFEVVLDNEEWPLLTKTRLWFQIFFDFQPYLGEWSNLTNIFQRGGSTTN